MDVTIIMEDILSDVNEMFEIVFPKHGFVKI